MNQHMNVAKEIFSQIQHFDRWAFARWGAKNYYGRPDGKILVDGAEKHVHQGIQLDVKGSKFRGRVFIALDPSDTYNLFFVKLGDKRVDYKCKLIEQKNGIYFDQLVEVIDDVIG